jgi:hypothetical protein
MRASEDVSFHNPFLARVRAVRRAYWGYGSRVKGGAGPEGNGESMIEGENGSVSAGDAEDVMVSPVVPPHSFRAPSCSWTYRDHHIIWICVEQLGVPGRRVTSSTLQ